ncbi:MAG: hypothetical protein IJ120_12470 [Solobacterium sp.]|nr:hypothetical protein [Solobacterium sp.]
MIRFVLNAAAGAVLGLVVFPIILDTIDKYLESDDIKDFAKVFLLTLGLMIAKTVCSIFLGRSFGFDLGIAAGAVLPYLQYRKRREEM